MEEHGADGLGSSSPSLTWTSPFAYLVGLIATDGFLTTKNTIGFSSTDLELVENLFLCLGKPPSYTTLTPEQQTGNVELGITPRSNLHLVRVTDAALYRKLLAVGVTPRKSLILGGSPYLTSFCLTL